MPPNVEQEYKPQWDKSTRLLVTILLLIAGVYAMTLLAPVFQMLTLAFIIAFLMYAPTRFITRRTPIPWTGAVALLYALVVVVGFFAMLVFVPALVRGVNSLLVSGEQAYVRLQDAMRDYDTSDGIIDVFGNLVDINPLVMPFKNFVLGTPPETEIDQPPSSTVVLIENVNLQQVLQNIFNVAGTVTGTVTSAIGSVAGFLSTVVISVLISILILIDLPNNRAALEKWIPPDYQREVYLLIRRIVVVWNGFFRGQVLIGIFIGLLTWIQLVLMGISNAEVLALITGLISLIPTIGGFIAIIPLSLVPLLQGSSVFVDVSNVGVAFLVVLVNLIINQIMWNIVAPKILGDALELPLAVIIVGVFIGAALGGVLGAFLVAPVMGTCRVVLLYTLNKLAERDPFPNEDMAHPAPAPPALEPSMTPPAPLPSQATSSA
jgi:predicted PurR-regulated permease PerM